MGGLINNGKHGLKNENGEAIIVLATGNKLLATSVAYEWTLWQTGYPDFLMFEQTLESALMPAIIGILFIFLYYLIAILKQRNKSIEI